MTPETTLLEPCAQPENPLVARAALVSLTFFCLTHFVIDLYSGALGALQPLLLNRFHMNFTQAGILAGVLSFSSSVLQPGWGYLSDRFHSGALGGILGGTLADRFGGRRVILISMIGSVPFLALFVFSSGWVSTLGLALSGLILLFTNPVNVVMGQELAPTQTGTVSALMMGFAWGTSGLLFIPLTGWISDLYSMQAAFIGLAAFPLAGFVLALKLPKQVA
jgi:MFS family permease